MTAADRIAEARALIEPLTGHTPGPWQVDAPEDESVEIAARIFAIAGLYETAPEALPDARLIAAAPALRDTVVALADLADAQAQENERLRGGRIDWEWLDAEITAIPTRYHGDPSHDHDAYWFKTEVLDLIRKAAGWDTDACAALGSEQDDPLMRTTFHVQV